MGVIMVKDYYPEKTYKKCFTCGKKCLGYQCKKCRCKKKTGALSRLYNKRKYHQRQKQNI